MPRYKMRFEATADLCGFLNVSAAQAMPLRDNSQRTNVTDCPDRGGFKVDCGPEKDEWKRQGIELGQRHDVTVFEIDDWYLRGRQSFGPGECRRIIAAPGWEGVRYGTVKVYACVARQHPKQFRYLSTSPAHYHSARVLPLEQSMPRRRKRPKRTRT
jgi:hypothetical protein